MKIQLDKCLEPSIAFCWRQEWYNSYHSFHNLLSKFAYLNAMSARHLAELFLARNTGHRVRSIKGLNISLLDSKHFDNEIVADLFGVDEGDISYAFPYPHFDHIEFSANRNLCFCPRCMAKGFHATIFQLDIIGRCPIHGCDLIDECPQCGFGIPYTLNGKWFNNPFYCPNCDWDLAPVVHSYKQKRIKLSKVDQKKVNSVIDLIGLKHRLFPVSINLDRYYSLYGHGYNMVSEPLLHRQKNGYFDFLHSILKKLEFDIPTPKHIKPAPLLAYSHNGYIPSEKQKKRVKHVRKKRTKHKRRWLEWDDKYWALYPVYASIRRHLWRHLLKEHQHCVKTIARHIWWRLEEESSEPVCPHAYAFLQWRMFWEGFGVPGHLYQDPTHAPTRLLVWLCDTAPICPNCWPANMEQWVMHRIFAMDCMNSYKEWLEIAKLQKSNPMINWSQYQTDGHSVTYWAVEGEEWPDQPINLYLERVNNQDNEILPKAELNLKQHLNWNKNQIELFLH